MAFKKRDDFYENRNKSSKEVPFLSEVTDDNFEVIVNASWPIFQIYKSPKGLLIITAMFKTFIFTKSVLCDSILKDVMDSVINEVAIDSLSVFVNNNKTVTYGEDDRYLQVWTKREHNFYATLASVEGEDAKSDGEIPF
jgi:hypothetical protein